MSSEHGRLLEPLAKIIAIKCNVEGAKRYLFTFDFLNFSGDSSGNGYSPGPHAHHYQFLNAPVMLDNFVRQARDRSSHPLFVDYFFFNYHCKSHPNRIILFCFCHY